MITYTSVAVNREQRRTLVTNGTIEDARDACHSHHKKSALPPLMWATGFHGLVGITQDGPSPLTPFQVRYTIEATDDAG
jgi:hypothetical protein